MIAAGFWMGNIVFSLCLRDESYKLFVFALSCRRWAMGLVPIRWKAPMLLFDLPIFHRVRKGQWKIIKYFGPMRDKTIMTLIASSFMSWALTNRLNEGTHKKKWTNLNAIDLYGNYTRILQMKRPRFDRFAQTHYANFLRQTRNSI